MDEKEVIRQYYELRSCRAVAEVYGCNGETIRRILQKNGIKLTGWKRTPKHALPKKKYPRKSEYVRVQYERTCEYCGKQFIAHDRRKMFCSRRCKDIDHRIRCGIKCNINTEPYHKMCAICGKPFDTYRDATTTCSPECARAKKELYDKNRQRPHDKRSEHTLEEYKQIVKIRAKQRAEKKAIEKRWQQALHTVQRECEECGALFYCLDSETRKTCSTECSRKYKNRKSDHRIPKSQRVDKISLKRLFKRDNGICYLCGEVCDWNDWKVSKKGYRYPGDNYPSREHVIPVCDGGLDAWSNVRLAHMKCNQEKADGIVLIEPLSHEVAYSEKYQKTESKRTAQYTLDGKLIRIFESTAQIRRELGLNDKHIQNVCRENRTGNAYGYHWEYIDEHDQRCKTESA